MRKLYKNNKHIKYRKIGMKNLFIQRMDVNFQTLRRESDPQIEEADRTI